MTFDGQPAAPAADSYASADDDLGADILAALEANTTDDGADHAGGEVPSPDAPPTSDATDTADAGLQDAATDADPDGGTALQAPASWAESAKQALASVPEAARAEILREITRRERDVDARLRGNAAIERLIEPMRDALKARGVEPAQYLGNLLQWNQALSGDPVQALERLHARTIGDARTARAVISRLAQRFNISEYDTFDDGADAEQAGNRQPDPHVIDLQRRLEQREIEDARREWAALVSEKRPDGTPKYPHAEALRADVVKLIRANPTMSYAEALETAQYVNPEVRAKVLAGVMDGGRPRRAGQGRPPALPRGRSDRVAVGPTSGGDLDEDLRAAYAASGVSFDW